MPTRATTTGGDEKPKAPRKRVSPPKKNPSIKQRNRRGQAIPSVDTREQDKNAWDLRARHLTYGQIAEALSIGETTARESVLRHGKLIVTEDDIEIKARMLAELDLIGRTVTGVMQADHPVLYQGMPVVNAAGVAVQDAGIVLDAAKALLALQRRLTDLIGLDAPRKHEVSGPEGGPIIMESEAERDLRSRVLKLTAMLDQPIVEPE
jgi:hypothetical protein